MTINSDEKTEANDKMKKNEKQKKSKELEINDSAQENMQEKSIRELLLPEKVDASHFDYLEIFSKVSRFIRSFYVTTLPRETEFSKLLSDIYDFGNINTSVYIEPIPETIAQNDLNKEIVDVQSQRLVAQEREDWRKDRVLSGKQLEAEYLRDQIADGYNRLFEATIVSTLYADNKAILDAISEELSIDISKKGVGLKATWAMQEEAFRTNMPLNENELQRKHTFDKIAMASVFPFVIKEIGNDTGIPIGINKQTELPIIFDNFNRDADNFNMVIIGKSGSGKTVTLKTLLARSVALTQDENIIIDTEGDYGVLTEVMCGNNIVLGKEYENVVNMFDLEEEAVKDEITGREVLTLDIHAKIEDVTNIILAMIRLSGTKANINEITKKLVADIVSDEYEGLGIGRNVESLYADDSSYANGNFIMSSGEFLTKHKKNMPTLGSWYARLLKRAEDNKNEEYVEQYKMIVKAMKKYCKEHNSEFACFDGQTNLNLDDENTLVNIDISKFEDDNTKNIAHQILINWIYEKSVKKNSENRKRAKNRRIVLNEIANMIDCPEMVELLNLMTERAKRRNISLVITSNQFDKLSGNMDVMRIIMGSEIKLMLAQNAEEATKLKEIFRLTDGEVEFMLKATRGDGILKIGQESAIISIKPTQKELEFIETSLEQLEAANS